MTALVARSLLFVPATRPDMVAKVGRSKPDVVVLESVPGIADARELLSVGPDGVYFGAEDFAASIGGRRTPAGTEVLYARSRVALFAALYGVTSLDQVVTAVRDAEAFRTDAR